MMLGGDSQPPKCWGFDELRHEGFSEPVLATLEGVTRREGETCEVVIRRSLAHLEDNRDLRRLAITAAQMAGGDRRFFASRRMTV